MFHIEYDLRQDKHLTDTPLHFSIRKKEVNAMTCDESLYRQYLSGDDEGLNALMKKYGDPLTLYIDGYLHDVHEAEELMLDVFAYLFTKKPKIRDGGFKAYLYKAARHMALRHKSKRKPLFSLDELTGEPDGRLLALCAMGGVFSEGIDLPADRLCGAAVVGVGLPQIGVERDALRKRYDEAYGDGYAYAYVYPGVGKVLQAAGRVIRSENDRGALLLIDDRYAADPYPALLPAQWTLRRVFTDKQIAEQLRGFWNQN